MFFKILSWVHLKLANFLGRLVYRIFFCLILKLYLGDLVLCSSQPRQRAGVTQTQNQNIKIQNSHLILQRSLTQIFFITIKIVDGAYTKINTILLQVWIDSKILKLYQFVSKTYLCHKFKIYFFNIFISILYVLVGSSSI